MQIRCRRRDEIEALLRIEPADHREQRPVGVESQLGAQLRAADVLAGQVGRRVSGGNLRVRGRIPELRIDAVDDPGISVAQ